MAIIFLVIIVRLILFPLAQKQFASMAKMRVLQPKVKVLQERYKEDKPRLQQEMMKLYKEEKVNPMAGCLPIFLQIPIFYALYKVLLIAVEMRHQPFALWIKDLTAPDPLTPINLFGLLPFQPPGLHRDRHPADPGRRHHVAPAEDELGADGSDAAEDLRLDAVDPGGDHGAVRGRLPGLLGDQQFDLDPADLVPQPQDGRDGGGPGRGPASRSAGKAKGPSPAARTSPPPPSPRPPSPSRPKGRQKSRRR